MQNKRVQTLCQLHAHLHLCSHRNTRDGNEQEDTAGWGTDSTGTSLRDTVGKNFRQDGKYRYSAGKRKGSDFKEEKKRREERW